MISRELVKEWMSRLKHAQSVMNTGDLDADFDYYDERDVQAVIADMDRACIEALRDEVDAEVRSAS